MPHRQVPIVAGGYYHVYNRGCDRQPIFFDAENYAFFLKRTRRWLLNELETVERPVDILAYCLMPNHFHFLVRVNCDDFSRRMQSLCQSYSKALNKRRERVGPLFQGRFEAKAVECEDYLFHLSRYIHLNPVAARLVHRPEEWEFSSYRDYVGSRAGRLPSASLVLKWFADCEAYRRFVESRMEQFDSRIAELLFDEE